MTLQDIDMLSNQNLKPIKDLSNFNFVIKPNYNSIKCDIGNLDDILVRHTTYIELTSSCLTYFTLP